MKRVTVKFLRLCIPTGLFFLRENIPDFRISTTRPPFEIKLAHLALIIVVISNFLGLKQAKCSKDQNVYFAAYRFVLSIAFVLR